MADTKISALTAATTPLTGTEQVPVVQSGTSKQATVGQLVGSWKVPVDAATTAALTGTVTFSAGTFTWTAANVTTLDGVTLAVGSRVLVKNQGGTATNLANGIYTVTAQSGTTTATWTRATASDTTAEIAGAFVAVRGGTTNGGTVWATGFKVGDTLNTTAMGWYEVLDSSQLASTNPAALGTAAPGTGTTLARADHVHPTTNLALSGLVTASGLTQNTARILGRTTASTGAVEEISVGSGLSLSAGTLSATASGSATAWKQEVRVATIGTSVGTVSGATLTSAPVTLDGVTLVLNDRVLVKDHSTAAANGIYYVTNAGTTGNTATWTRATDADTVAELAGAAVVVTTGTLGGSAWHATTKATDTLGTTAVAFDRLLDDGYNAVPVLAAAPSPATAGQVYYDSTANPIGEASFLPSDHLASWIAWTEDSARATSTTSTTTIPIGLAFFVKTKLVATSSISNIILQSGTIASGITSAYVGVYALDGTRLGVSANVATTLTGSTGTKTIPLATPTATLSAGTVVWLAHLQAGGTGAPAALASPGQVFRAVNAGLTAAQSRVAYISGQTTLPSPLTTSSLLAVPAGTDYAPAWMAVS